MDKSKRNGAIKERFRINNRIRAREIRLIQEDGEQLGIVSLYEALRMAEDRNLDVVEVAPNAVPPVCRLMDYGKFRYEQSKKDREARKHQKQTEIKEVRLRPKTDTHDLEVKANQARRFLHAGDKVKFIVRFRGREMAHTNIGREILEEIIEKLRDIAVVEQRPTLEGRAISLILAPGAKTIRAAKQAKQQPQSRQPQATSENKKQPPVPVKEEIVQDSIDDENDIDDNDDIDDDLPSELDDKDIEENEDLDDDEEIA